MFQKVAVHALIQKENKFLLTRRSLVDDWKSGVWDIPGGSVEFGENHIHALKRELLKKSMLQLK